MTHCQSQIEPVLVPEGAEQQGWRAAEHAVLCWGQTGPSGLTGQTGAGFSVRAVAA